MEASGPARLLTILSLALAGALSAPVLGTHVGPEPITIFARCNQDQQPIAAQGEHANLTVHFMEWDPVPPVGSPPWRCWAHLGHHTYFVGQDTVYELHRIVGRGTFVETSAVGLEVGLSLLPSLEDGVAIETSIDGRDWTVVHRLALPNSPLGELPDSVSGPDDTPLGDLPDADLPDGDILHQARYDNFAFDVALAQPEPFRFLRLRMPISALGGLSGYVDGSRVFLSVTPDAGIPAPALAPGTRRLDCQSDILEDVLAGNPCRFGGPNHFEAASFYHTYFMGGAEVANFSGNVTVLPYRVLGTATHHVGGLPITMYLQGSVDGSTWTVLHSFDVTEGVRTTFQTPELGGVDAKFLRLSSEAHRTWASVPGTRYHSSWIWDSDLVVHGNVTAPDLLTP